MKLARLFFGVCWISGCVSCLAAAELKYPAAKAERNGDRVAIVQRDDFFDKQGVSLKQEVEEKAFSNEIPPDLVFKVQAPKQGRYWILTSAGVDDVGKEKMRKAKSKFESLMLRISVDDSQPTERVVFVPWHPMTSVYLERTGKFDLSGKPQTIKVWLPKGVQLNFLELRGYSPPKVPPTAETYKPEIVPPTTRPRLWVNAESLPVVRERLTKGENAPIWEKYRNTAIKPFSFEFKPGVEIKYNTALEKAAAAKAFVYLMTGDAVQGQEAVRLIRDYFSVVSFGNILDITREIGVAINSGSLVYDWCYDLMSEEDRKAVREGLLRLADDMEMGWPPFIGMIVNGHGNEMQMSRDLLSMGIALYGDDSVPYRYCAYRVLEELKPMLAYQYRSPRHNQGGSYGPFRFECDMTAAWYFKRMTGRDIFHENIKQVPYSWIYQRLPDGSILPDGDGSYSPGFRRYANLLNFTYGSDPILKGEYLRQYAAGTDPMRWLLLNDPDLVAQPDLKTLPLTKDFGPILGSMIARTGWNMGPDSDDVVVEMKGGGKHFGNHQHSDAGSFQIYYRGMLAGDLGIYKFYGTPYDMNFNKRSVSHSMMLVYDPDESFGSPGPRSSIGNDGGALLHLRCPTTPKQAETEALFRNGVRRAAAFGPDPREPVYSFFSVDLADAYSEKIKEYTRSFCFINRKDSSVPGVLFVHDDIRVSNPSFKKYWQINTFSATIPSVDGIETVAGKQERQGRFKLSMLLPVAEDRVTEILSGEVDAHRVFGVQYAPPVSTVQTKGSRVLFSPRKENERDEFVTVMQMVDEKGKDLPVSLLKADPAHVVLVGEHIVGFAKTSAPIDSEWSLDVPSDREYQVVLTGLSSGKWSIVQSGKTETVEVKEGESTLYFSGKGARRFTPPPKAR